MDREGIPIGWSTPDPDLTPGFKVQRDPKKVREGRYSARLDVDPVSLPSIGNLIQWVPATSYRGKRVRFSGYLATQDIRVATPKVGMEGAFLWLRVDDVDGESSTLANMSGERLHGTSDWQQVETVVQVSDDAESVVFGVMITASGTVWADSLRLEIVDDSVPTTALFERKAELQARSMPPLSEEQLSSLLTEMKPRVERLRGLEFKEEVSVGIHSTDEFLESMKAAMQHEDHAEQMEAMQTALFLLGVLDEPITLDDLLDGVAQEVAGYYDYLGTKKLFVIDSCNQGPLSEYILAHELAHALEDQHYDLGAMPYENGDGMAALGALIEGSATVLGNTYLTEEILQRIGEDGAREFAHSAESLSGDQEGLPPVMLASLMFSYVQGARFLAPDGADTACPSEEDWLHVWNHPPTSTEQILHPEKYWQAEKRDDPKEVDLPDLASSLGQGWSLVHEDVWGEFTLYHVVADHGWGDEGAAIAQLKQWIHPASAGWGGDCAQIYRGPDGEQALVWATLWDTHEDREEFLDAVADRSSEDLPYLRAVYAPADPEGQRALLFLSTQAMADERQRLWKQLRAVDPNWDW